MDKTTGVLTALVLAPMAIVVVVALIRGYKVDIHFDRDGSEGGMFSRRRKKKPDPPDDNKGDA